MDDIITIRPDLDTDNALNYDHDLEYTDEDDFEVEVEHTFEGGVKPTSGPMWSDIEYEPDADYVGTITRWLLTIWPTHDDLIEYLSSKLNKPVEELTQQDVDNFNDSDENVYRDFNNYLKDLYLEDAEKDAEENYDPDNDVDNWEEKEIYMENYNPFDEL